MSIFLKKCFSFTINKQITQKNIILLLKPKYYSTTTSHDNVHETSEKLIRVAVIGVPNVGKSTFINNLINHRVCPTSNKVHTTRRSNKAIYTEKDTQILLFDTPGLVTQKEIKKHKLDSSFKSSYRHSIQHADIIAVMHDVSNSWTRHQLHSTVLDTLNAYPKLPSFLILNKIDLLKSKRVLLNLIKSLTNNNLSNKRRLKDLKQEVREKKDIDGNETNQMHGWSNFSEVFMVSSLTGSGLNEILHMLINQAKPGKWLYSSDMYTDETPEALIVDSVRARLLDYLPQEIPYLLSSAIEYYSVENDTIYASVQVVCPSTRLERLICGESNGKLKQITERVTSDLVETFGKAISLTITTQVKKSAEAEN